MSIYLDYNATAPLRPQVIARVAEVMASPANASSVHAHGRTAKKILEESRKAIAENISVFPNEIIFTSCGSEANAMALRGFAGRRVLVSTVEHSSVLRHSRESGNPVLIPVTSDGIVDLNVLDRMLSHPHHNPPPQAGEGNFLVSIMLANNETGVIQPIREVAEICKKHGALLHTDAVQALGKIPIDFTALGVDMMTLAAHKMGGPVGAAALVVRQDLAIAPLLSGGGQELRRRAGTENVAAIAGFAKAVELIDFAQMERLRGWLQKMEAGKMVFGSGAPRLPNTSCIALPPLSQEVLLMKLDLAGFAVSAGSACSSGRIEPSHVLTAMGVEKSLAASAIRISGGWATTQDEIELFAETCVQLLEKK